VWRNNVVVTIVIFEFFTLYRLRKETSKYSKPPTYFMFDIGVWCKPTIKNKPTLANCRFESTDQMVARESNYKKVIFRSKMTSFEYWCISVWITVTSMMVTASVDLFIRYQIGGLQNLSCQTLNSCSRNFIITETHKQASWLEKKSQCFKLYQVNLQKVISIFRL
jgi:hypothetical protein